MTDPESQQLENIRQRWDGNNTISGVSPSTRVQQAEQDIRYLLKVVAHLRQHQSDITHKIDQLRADGQIVTEEPSSEVVTSDYPVFHDARPAEPTEPT